MASGTDPGAISLFEVIPLPDSRSHSSANHSNIRTVKESTAYHLPQFGVFIMLALFIYVVYNMLSYRNANLVAGYEVTTGSLSADQVYTGIALRQEIIAQSEYPGYVNYYAREGDRIPVGGLAYTVDESGRIMEYMNTETGSGNVLNSEDILKLRPEVSSFAAGFDEKNFSDIYDFRDTFISTVQKMASGYILKDISQIAASDLTGSIHQCYAAETGILVFSTDGYESADFESVTAEDLTPEAVSSYEKKNFESNMLVVQGDPVYKVCTDENWSLVIGTTPEEAERLTELQYIQVRFIKNQDVLWASVTSRKDAEDHAMVKLSFTNSMVTFCSDRYLRVELITESVKGLKVPNSSIVEADFFLVPKEYITVGLTGDRGVLRQTYTEDGQPSSEFITAVPYSETDKDYYLDQSTLRVGDVLIMPDSTETCTLTRQAGLIGVYNINKGYADFREVNILYRNDEYSIVEPNTLYGLSEYDHIVLDASTISPDELIFS